MNTSHRRIALLTGASIAAIGAATPAFAVTEPSIPYNFVGPTITDTIDICIDLSPDADCLFGEFNAGPGVVNSLVNDDVNGQIEVTAVATAAGGDVILTLQNNAPGATIAAVALATAPVAGLASANATINTAIEFRGTAPDVVSLNFDNNAPLLIEALAVATGTNAQADATISPGIDMFGNSTGGDATVDLDNVSVMTIAATAIANGGTNADASAAIFTAIDQSAIAAGTAVVSLNNAALATINITAFAGASATAGGADANAAMTSGIVQYAQANAGGLAAAGITNAGVINVNGTAIANGTSFASASASVSDIIDQSALAIGAGGTAVVSVINDGAINVGAVASAVATSGNAFASADMDNIIEQDARATAVGGSASAVVANAGSINLVAIANAVGTSFASADASITDVIEQDVTGAAFGFASVTNSGAINLAAVANAVATSGSASASASADDIISQDVNALTGAATGTIVNSGTIAAAITAVALGVTNADADASVSNVIEQFVNGGTAANGTISNSGAINVAALAIASATGSATASASITSAIQQSVTATAGTANAVLTNSGAIAFNATALANATDSAAAFAAATGISQTASGTNANASFTNSGTITFSAFASAAAHIADATATAGGINQSGFGGVVNLNFANAGLISAAATAVAVGSDVFADASAFGVYQSAAAATSAYLAASNAGTIALTANAFADGVDTASAYAFAGTGMRQYASAPFVSESMVNSGSIVLAANATAEARIIGFARASATAAGGMAQSAGGFFGVADTAVQFMSNTGLVSLSAAASASGGGAASAYAYATSAMQQIAIAANNVTQTMVNGGTVTATANATAVANGTVVGISGQEFNVGTAVASAFASGMAQTAFALDVIATPFAFVLGTAAIQSMTNSGSLNVGAHAFASAPATTTPLGAIGSGSAFAYAGATGARQVALAGVTQAISFVNSGDINVNAAATATGATGSAAATAIGYLGLGLGGVVGGTAALTAVVVNSGTMNVSATAVAPGTAFASANGIVVNNLPVAVFAGTVFQGFAGNAVNGTISNAGTINVVASASGGLASTASAFGIYVQGGINNMTIDNSGVIAVDAITANGGSASSFGILVEDTSTLTPAPLATDILTINNSGDIIARISTDGGASFQRGVAIDVENAPNNTVINLLEGNIYGHIDIQDGDVINVTSGETSFDGIINPECLPVGGIVSTANDPVLASCGVGTLNITDGGTLFLRDDSDSADYDGPSYVFVDEFNMGPTGTIAFELEPDFSVVNQPAGTYPQIFAEVANLDGTLEARIDTGGQLIDDVFYDNLIDANVRNGTFDQCLLILNGADVTNSLLLDTTCIYDAQANVDLGINRIAFNAVPGLNGNGTAVGEGLECLFDTDLTGGFANLLNQLFLFTDPVNYNIALNQLAGSSYANYLQSFPSLGVHYNDLIAKATDCEIPALAGSVLECRASAPIHVWGQLDYQWRKADGDNEAGSSRSKRFTGLLGIDANVGNSAIVGLSVGHVINNFRDRQFGDSIESNGFQVGLYGVFDPGQFYVKAMATRTAFEGESERSINFVGLAPGAIFAADIEGDPDVRMWTFGLHGGYRIGMGGNSVLTPYLNYDYVNARMKEFIEDGTTGAELHLDKNSAKHSFLTGGVKWATQMGGVVPEVNLGYRYRFGDKRTNITQAFLCQTDTCAFDVESAGQKRGNFLAGVSIGGKMGPVDLRIGYEGEFNSDITSHSGNFKFVVPFGARAAPPPPPPPAPVIVPPAPVEVAPPPPPPPPPPAPVERGERGQ